MKDFIETIKQRGILGRYTRFCSTWNNGATGAIVLDREGYVVFEQYTEDMKQSEAKEPIRLTNVRYGFVHWLLLSIQSNDVNFKTFYNACKDYFVSQYKNSPDSWKWKDNIDEYFANIHHSAMQKQLVDIPLYEYLDKEDVRQIRSYCSNYLEYLQYKLPKAKEKFLEESKQSQEEKRLPSQLDTAKAKVVFKRLESLNCYKQDGNLYKWTGKGAEFGAFVDLVSEHLKVRPSNQRLPWKPFTQAFQVDEKKQRAAQKAVSQYNKGWGERPDIYQDIQNKLE